MHARYLIIGGGLSGLAAAIRIARFKEDVLLVERHIRPGGLNSYYYRQGKLFETGLHAITNYAPPGEKKAPLNRLLRQLKIKRDHFPVREQRSCQIHFGEELILTFSNDFSLFCDNVCSLFGDQADAFLHFVSYLDTIDPFAPCSFVSARSVLKRYFTDELLIDMILCPLMFYGSSREHDMDFKQFVIMFRAVFQEGMFRPAETMKEVLDLLVEQYRLFGGILRFGTGVRKINHDNNSVFGVTLESGEEISCDFLLSTAGIAETRRMLGQDMVLTDKKRLGFVENIISVRSEATPRFPEDTTIIFYNKTGRFLYRCPELPVDFSSGVICFPGHFEGIETRDNTREIRTTHLASPGRWQALARNQEQYDQHKTLSRKRSVETAEAIIGAFADDILYEDSFTPVTIKKYTGKIDGAIYGNPEKIQDGKIGFDNLFLAGTDQGFLGIVGSMLSGISIANQHLLNT